MKRLFVLITTVIVSTLCMAVPAFADDECVHDWTDWTTVKEATCGANGKMVRQCNLCQEYEYDIIYATGNHDWSKWRVSKKSTVFKKGSKYRKCYNCGKKQSKAIAKAKAFAKFKKKSYKLKKGKKLSLKKKVKFGKGDSIKSWRSSNKNVVSVTKNGTIKAKKKGTAKVTVFLKSGKKAVCKVKVTVPKKKKKSGGTVYWVPNGSVYHCTKSCPTLSRSRVIYSGSLSECPKSRPCKVCY